MTICLIHDHHGKLRFKVVALCPLHENFILNLEQQLQQRSENKCELCKSAAPLKVHGVAPSEANTPERAIYICDKCTAQIEKKEELDGNHWQCLSESMWSEVIPVQIVAWRMLNRLKAESWAVDLLDMMYLDEENMAWAKSTGDHESDGAVNLHRDVNGSVLQAGDTVVLIKSLDVKGSTLNARLGTVVKNIRLVDDNTEQVEGKIEGQTIVILTKYLKKQGAAQAL